jgi:hypothetical protein
LLDGIYNLKRGHRRSDRTQGAVNSAREDLPDHPDRAGL